MFYHHLSKKKTYFLPSCSSLLLFSLSYSKVREYNFIKGINILLLANQILSFYRTKQEIEADYNRRKIVKKFRKRIQKFENAEMDAEMNLRKGKTIGIFID